MHLTHEVPLTIISTAIFLYLIGSKSEPPRHHFKVKPNPNYPDADAFAPSPLTSAITDLNTFMTKHSSTLPPNYVYSPFEVIRSISLFQKLSDSGEIRDKMTRVLYDKFSERDFWLKMTNSADLYKDLEVSQTYRPYQTIWLREDSQLLSLTRYQLLLIFGTKIFDFGKNSTSSDIKLKIDQMLAEAHHSLTEKIQIDPNPTCLQISYIQTNLRFAQPFKTGPGIFNSYGKQAETNSEPKKVPFLFNPKIDIKTLTLENGAQLIHFPLLENNLGLIFKWNRHLTETSCPLCKAGIVLSEFENLMYQKAERKSIAFPEFEILNNLDFRAQVAQYLNQGERDFEGTIFEIGGKYFLKPISENFKVGNMIQFGHVNIGPLGVNQIGGRNGDVGVGDILDADFVVDYPFRFYLFDHVKKIVIFSGRIVKIN